MIFYFTGTGNSLWVAQELGKIFDMPLISIAGELHKEEKELVYELHKDEMLFFVFPVHSWGPALPVTQFISRLRLKGYTNQFVYSICSCGDESGHTDRITRKALAKRNISLSGSYSIQMPNNYILLPGFDVDSPKIEQDKLDKAPRLLSNIADTIRMHAFTHLYTRGSLPFIKSRMIYPLFIRYALNRNNLHATDACIACGICKKACPTGTISLKPDNRPIWAKKGCVQCLACIHFCPARAIEYGKISQSKGRYHHPDIRIKNG